MGEPNFGEFLFYVFIILSYPTLPNKKRIFLKATVTRGLQCILGFLPQTPSNRVKEPGIERVIEGRDKENGEKIEVQEASRRK